METNMNRYEPKTPRFAFAIAALALSLTTMGVMVGAPAALDVDQASVMATRQDMPTIRIEVVAKREAPMNVATAKMPHVDQ
jgi:hypothetical protein